MRGSDPVAPEGDEFEAWLQGRARNDPAFSAALEDAARRSSLLDHLIASRHDLGLAQKAVAKLMETTQSAVSELEGGGTDPRLSTLQRYARAVGTCLYVHLADSPEAPFQPIATTSGVSIEDAAPMAYGKWSDDGWEPVLTLAN